MVNKITIEIDVDSIITAPDKAAALYKAIKDDVLNRYSMVEEIRKRIIDDLIKDGAYEKLKKSVGDEIQKHYGTPEYVKKYIESKSYEIGGVISKIIVERKDLLENEVLRYMSKSNFQKNIATIVESHLVARVESLILPPEYNDND